MMEPSAHKVNGKGVNSSNALFSYKEGKATPGFHKPTAAPTGKGKPTFQRNSLVAKPGLSRYSIDVSQHVMLRAIKGVPSRSFQIKTSESHVLLDRSQPIPHHTTYIARVGGLNRLSAVQ